MIYLQELSTIPVEPLSITAIIETALCVGSGGSSGSLADKPIVRRADGKLYIPASQLKGRIRHECEKLARGLGWPICHSPKPDFMCPQRQDLSAVEDAEFQRDDYQVPDDDRYHCFVCQLFGNPTLPSRIIFDDLICETEFSLSEVIRPGVTLNRRRRTAEDQKLYFLETSPMNTELAFEGEISFLSGCSEAGKLLMLAALKQISALGGSKSTGLGWLRWEIGNLTTTDEAWEKLIPTKETQ